VETLERMGLSIPDFIARWSVSGASERANKDAFLIDLCEALELPRPNPATGDPTRDTYVFERDATLVHEGAPISVGHIDLYKEGCFILEAKQGSEKGSRKLGTAKRGTPGWNIAMKDAFGQALGYARSFDRPPPFIVACDIGHCFDLYASFERTIDYTPFPNALSSRLYLPEIDKHADTLRSVFLDPASLDPARKSTRVTREVAVHLADLAKALEADGHGGEAIATFLMRCIFTMFAEDVGLLPERTFTESVERFWLPTTVVSRRRECPLAGDERGWPDPHRREAAQVQRRVVRTTGRASAEEGAVAAAAGCGPSSEPSPQANA
jgi:hypothetical protein